MTRLRDSAEFEGIVLLFVETIMKNGRCRISDREEFADAVDAHLTQRGTATGSPESTPSVKQNDVCKADSGLSSTAIGHLQGEAPPRLAKCGHIAYRYSFDTCIQESCPHAAYQVVAPLDVGACSVCGITHPVDLLSYTGGPGPFGEYVCPGCRAPTSAPTVPTGSAVTTEQALAVECPKCHRPNGKACVVLSDAIPTFGTFCGERIDLAREVRP